MAAVAVETEEERRLREEREAMVEMQQLLASRIAPPGVPQLPQEAIPAENVSFTNGANGQIQIDLPEGYAPPFNRQMIGDEQYQQELARAQRGNGFLAPEVGIAGGLISGGYDPSTDPREIVARREAENLQRNQYISGLVRGGATYAEALRAGLGRYPNTVNPRLALQAEALALRGSRMKSSLNPEVTTVDGVKMYRTGPNSFAQARPEAPAKPPPETVAGQKILTGQITDARNVLERAEKVAAEDRSDVNAVNAVNAALRARSKLRGLEENFMRGSTQWMGSATAPAKQAATPAQAKAVNEIIRMTKDGKRAVYDAQTKEFIRFE